MVQIPICMVEFATKNVPIKLPQMRLTKNVLVVQMGVKDANMITQIIV